MEFNNYINSDSSDDLEFFDCNSVELDRQISNSYQTPEKINIRKSQSERTGSEVEELQLGRHQSNHAAMKQNLKVEQLM